MWDGIACWPYLGHNFKTFKNHGINMVGSTYPEAWTLLYEAGDLDSMARAYSAIVLNLNLERNIDLRVKNNRRMQVQRGCLSSEPELQTV